MNDDKPNNGNDAVSIPALPKTHIMEALASHVNYVMQCPAVVIVAVQQDGTVGPTWSNFRKPEKIAEVLEIARGQFVEVAVQQDRKPDIIMPEGKAE